MKLNVNVFAGEDLLIENLAGKLKQFILSGSNESKFLNIALSGGKTPKTFFDYLSRNILGENEWRKVRLFWVDERCVPPGHPESNYGMTKKHLLDKISIPEENVFRIRGESDPADEAERYSTILNEHISLKNNIPEFDLILLGLGEDGHTASIFPSRLDLLVSRNNCEVTMHPVSNRKRISLTGRVINNGAGVVFLVTGKNKSDAVSAVINKVPGSEKLPAAGISPADGVLEWYLDREAACKLKV